MDNLVFNINNLPKKSDFTCNIIELLNKIKEEYLNEYNQWKKDRIKEEYIEIETNFHKNTLSNIHYTSIKSLFGGLGFADDDIDIGAYNDTHNIFIRLRILN